MSDASLGIEAALKKYLGEVTPEVDASNVEEKEIVVKSITSAVIDSNTYYYLTDTENEQYVVSIKVAKNNKYVGLLFKLISKGKLATYFFSCTKPSAEAIALYSSAPGALIPIII